MRKSESFCLGSGHVTFWQWLTEEIPREQKWDRLLNVSMGGSWDQSLCIPKGQLSFCQPENEGPLRGPQSIKSLGVWKISTYLESLQGAGFCAAPWKHDMWQHTLGHIMELVPSFHLYVGPRTSASVANALPDGRLCSPCGFILTLSSSWFESSGWETISRKSFCGICDTQIDCKRFLFLF